MEIILYSASVTPTPVIPPVTLPVINIRLLGYLLVGFALVLAGAGFWPILRLEVGYRLGSKPSAEETKAPEAGPSFAIATDTRLELAKLEAAKYGVGLDFSLVIPKIGAAAKVVANVDAGNEAAYRAALKEGVAHAAGTGFPGGKDTIYLFAHSTNSLANVSRYNAIFYLLKELSPGDRVIIFYNHLKYEYNVTERFLTDAKDTQWLNGNGQERLVLQTCWPPGTIQKRLIVVAKPI